MHTDHRSKKSFGHTVRGLVDVCLSRFLCFVGDVEGLGPLVTVVMARRNLQGPSVGHDGVDANGVPRSGKGVPDRAFCFENGKAQMVHKPIDNLQILLDLTRGVVLVDVGRVRFEEVDFSHANEGTRLLRFVPEGVDHLVDLQRQVSV